MTTQPNAAADTKGSRFITGVVLLAGYSTLGLGLGLLLEDPGSGLMVGFGLGLAAIGMIRAIRGL
jgi:hypothetical protein